MGPHDGRYKLFFSHRRMMEDLVGGFLQEGWRHGLDLETLEPVPTDFVSADLSQRQADCLWRARFRGKEGTSTDFYLLVEFQSKPDPYMPLRLLCYEALLLERLVRQQRLAVGGALPPVVALVIPRGSRRWNAPRELRQLFAPVPLEVALLLPGLAYLVIDRRRVASGAFDQPDNVAAAFFRIEDARSPGELLDLVRPLSRMLPEDGEPELRQAFTELLTETFRTTFPEVKISHVEDLEDLHVLEENMMRWRRSFIRETEKQVRKRVEKQVRKQVEKQERAEGQVSGMQHLLQRQMEMRYGPLPPAVRRQVGEISSTEELEELAGRLLTAASLSDLGFRSE